MRRKLEPKSRTRRPKLEQPAEAPAPRARETLVRVGKHLFAQHGLSGISIRDIAKAANMNSSQISYYFTNKEGLYRACLQDITESRISIARQILAPPETANEYEVRLRLFVENLIGYFLEDRDTGLILIREYDRLNSPAAKIFKSHVAHLFELMTAFFSHAQKKKFCNTVGDSLILSSLLLGCVVNELRIDHIKEDLYDRTLKTPAERRKIVDQIVQFFSTK